MRLLLLVFIIASFFSQFVNCSILTSRPSLHEPLEIIVEGAENASVSLISPHGDVRNISLVGGYARVWLDLPGKWEIINRDSKKEIEVGTEKFYPEKRAEKKEFGFESVFGIVAVFVAIFSVLVAVAGVILIHYGPAWRKSPKLIRINDNGAGKVSFEAGSRPLEDVKIKCKERLLIASKKIMAFEKLEVRGTNIAERDRIEACFLEGGKRICIKEGEETVEGKENMDTSFENIKTGTGKRRLEKTE